MTEPITKVYDAEGHLLHDCAELGCTESWDGYDLETGQQVEGVTPPGPEWDTSQPGEAHLTQG